MGRVTVLAAVGIATVLAAAAAAESPDQASWTVLDTAARSNNVEIRLQTVAALETLGADNGQAVSRLLALLRRDKDPRVRKAAALSLGRMKAQQAIPELNAALKDNDEVAFGAAQALLDLGDTSGRKMLVAVLSGQKSDTPGIMTNAKREAERRIHHPAGTALFGAEGAVGAFIGPGYMGIEAINDTNSLRGKADPGRIAAVDCLAKDPDPYATTLLEWALSNSSTAVRAEAAKGLGSRKSAASIDKLRPLLKDRHGEVRTMAAASIIRLSAPHGSSLAAAAPAGATRADRR